MLTRKTELVTNCSMLWKFLTELQNELDNAGILFAGKPITRYRMAKFMRVAPNSYLEYINPKKKIKRIPANAIPALIAELQKLDPHRFSWPAMGKKLEKHFIKL